MANYLTFSSPNEFTLASVKTTFIIVGFNPSYTNEGNWDGILEYSTDTIIWHIWDGSTVLNSVNGQLYLRGINNTIITGPVTSDDGEASWSFNLTGENISCIGNIENLLDYTIVANGGHPVMEWGCYHALFSHCHALVKAPELLAITLSVECYQNMFEDCINLKEMPSLPATVLADYCYEAMFWGCTGLTTLSQLPATTLATLCYETMFSGCTNIKLSTTKTNEYHTEYRIPSIGEGVTATNALRDMFHQTGGTFTGTPEINTIYYTSNEIVYIEDFTKTIIVYNGNEIASLEAGQIATIKTANTEVEYDIIVKAGKGEVVEEWDGTVVIE